LGFPKQEHIALEMFRRLRSSGKPLPKTFLLGASFEFYWGTKKRAPMFYQRMGIEFVHRIISEPRRLAKRYLWDDLPFLGIAISELRKKP
jgi:N-acetylglucosaminyldiphosphoundecaprenol N-acetyl-beta-D-mannosaminyltransferase